MAKKKTNHKNMSRAEKQKLWDRTFTETLNLLNTKNRCVVIRPTGFGKTWIMARLINCFDHVLFLYQNEANITGVKNAYAYYNKTKRLKTTIPNVTFMSYMKWTKLKTAKKREKYLKDIDIIMADECSILGARETMKVMDDVLNEFPDIKLLGATATPDRMDMVDEIGRYFTDLSDITNPKTLQPFEYTLIDAMRDGMLKTPYYYYCPYAEISKNGYNEQILRKMANKELNKLAHSDKLEFEDMIEAKAIEMRNTFNMPNVIKRAVNSCTPSNDYQKFICFFPTIDKIEEEGKLVKEWFKSAFPKHTINILEISSKDKTSKENVHKLRDLKPKKKHIDLIFVCRMLDMSYHVDNLTGILMNRRTNSLNVYIQELGRILSSTCANAGIVLDVVSNIKRPALYALAGQTSERNRWLKKRLKKLKKKKTMSLAYDFAKVMMNTTGKIDANIIYNNFDITRKDIIAIKDAINNNDGHRFIFTDADKAELTSIQRQLDRKPLWTTPNNISQDFFIVKEEEATVREFIRKVAAEATSMVARRAWNNWLACGGQYKRADGSPMTRNEILHQRIADGKIPLPPFCYTRNLSIESVLDTMGIPDDGTRLSKSDLDFILSDVSDRLPT